MTDAATLDDAPLRPSYFARAFSLQYNLILLAGSALFSLAAASPLPLAVGAGTELLWLFVGSNLGGVRRWLDRREVFSEAEPAGLPAPETATELVFDRVYSHRINLFDRALAEIRALGMSRADPRFVSALSRLNPLRQTFLAVCQAHQGTARFLEATPEEEFSSEVERLQRVLGQEHDLGAKMGIRQALVLAKRRLEQRQSMTGELTTLALRLETIERGVAHLLKQGRALGGTRELGAEIEALAAEIGETRPA
jgi:hypothetical protein